MPANRPDGDVLAGLPRHSGKSRGFILRLFVVSVFSAVLFASVAHAASRRAWVLKFGDQPDQFKYYNASVNPKIEEASALGPMSFRVHDTDLWVADSIGGRIVCFSGNGKFKQEIRIPNLPPNVLIEDFCLLEAPKSHGSTGKSEVKGIWVADGADLFVRLISIPDGRELVKFGGQGDEPGKFLQIHQIEVGPTGRVYLGDYGRRKILAFSPDGKFLFEKPWTSSGFFIDSQDKLSMLGFTEGAGYIWMEYDSSGNLIKSTHLGLPGHQNPRLWCSDNAGGIWVSFVPPLGFRGYLNLIRFSADGGLMFKINFAPPQAMNRFLDITPDGDFFLAKANFEAAPRGNFSILNLPLSGKRR